jgi:hypothetical protein
MTVKVIEIPQLPPKSGLSKHGKIKLTAINTTAKLIAIKK